MDGVALKAIGFICWQKEGILNKPNRAILKWA